MALHPSYIKILLIVLTIIQVRWAVGQPTGNSAIYFSVVDATGVVLFQDCPDQCKRLSNGRYIVVDKSDRVKGLKKMRYRRFFEKGIFWYEDHQIQIIDSFEKDTMGLYFAGFPPAYYFMEIPFQKGNFVFAIDEEDLDKNNKEGGKTKIEGDQYYGTDITPKNWEQHRVGQLTPLQKPYDKRFYLFSDEKAPIPNSLSGRYSARFNCVNYDLMIDGDKAVLVGTIDSFAGCEGFHYREYKGHLETSFPTEFRFVLGRDLWVMGQRHLEMSEGRMEPSLGGKNTVLSCQKGWLPYLEKATFENAENQQPAKCQWEDWERQENEWGFVFAILGECEQSVCNLDYKNPITQQHLRMPIFSGWDYTLGDNPNLVDKILRVKGNGALELVDGNTVIRFERH